MRAMLAVVSSIALAVLSWGSYIPVLHKGQLAMDNSRLRPFICVGLAYFAIAVIVPLVVLIARGEKGSWSTKGLIYSLAGGTLGALGALGVILAQNSVSNPLFVIPLIFGGAPVVNTFVTMYLNKSYKEVGPLFLAGLILVISGAVTVLVFRPSTGSGPASTTFMNLLNSSLSALLWVAFTALCWGTYGPILHKGQAAMSGSRLRPFLCVGVAYVVVAVAIPFVLLGAGAEASPTAGTLTVRPTSSDAASVVQLTVTETAGERAQPVSEALVYLGEQQVGNTDSSGAIQLSAERAKEAGTFRISKEGYRDFSGKLDLERPAQLAVSLERERSAWTARGIGFSLAGGAAGALGALGIILAFNFGGKPVYVMPLVFGGAPVVGTIISLVMAGGQTPSPYFFAGLIVVAVGAVTVLVFAPKPHPHAVPAGR
jgi:drug/metabolite transporter (DMT)-like permease